MAKRSHPTTHKECLALCVPGPKTRAYGLGPGAHGLRLVVKPSGAGSWVQRFWRDGRSTDRGLGSLTYVTLAQAKRLAFENRAARYLNRRVDFEYQPIQRRTRKPAGPSFEELAREYIRDSGPGWTENVSKQWEQTLEAYAFPLIGSKAVASITRSDVLAVFRQDVDGGMFWLAKHATAKRLLSRVRNVLDAAIARELIASNPADAAIVKGLPKPNGAAKTKHHEALPYAELPAVMRTLEAKPGTAALALRFVALTACREAEAARAEWSEIDLEAGLWTIPASRAKTREAHEVPLSNECLGVLAEARELSGDTGAIFKGRNGSALHPASLRNCWKQWKIAATIHGLRSTFRCWCAEHGVSREVAERALAHEVGGVEGAYNRTTLLDQRRAVMEAWGSYLAR